MQKNNEKTNNELCYLLEKGTKQKDNSIAFQKKAGRITNCLKNIHPIQ